MPQKFLIVLNDPPYGTERNYNALRLARSLARTTDTVVRLFLIGDAVGCAKRGQKVPQGYYNLGEMVSMVVRHGDAVSACGTCIDARGIAQEELVEGVPRGSMDQLTEWTAWADKVLVF